MSDSATERQGVQAPPPAPGSPPNEDNEEDTFSSSGEADDEHDPDVIEAMHHAPPEQAVALAASNPTFYSAVLTRAIHWDPLDSHDWERQTYPPQFFLRIRKDLKEYQKRPPPGIVIVPRSEQLSLMDVLIIGPKDTPYEGGLFHFVLRFPPNYPLAPPRARLMTTSGNSVRFNPNFYKSGKVCLSLLGTWPGPHWTPALSTTALVVSIQSLMNDRPYFNEPGVEDSSDPATEHAWKNYNKVITHETLRVAVIENLAEVVKNPRQLPEQIEQKMLRHFFSNFESYVKRAEDLKVLDGKPMADPFASRGGTFNVTSKLIPDLLELGKQVTEEKYPFLKEPEPAVEPEEADSPGFPDDAYDQEEMAAHPEYFISDLSEYEQSGDDEGEDAPDDDEEEEPMEEN